MGGEGDVSHLRDLLKVGAQYHTAPAPRGGIHPQGSARAPRPEAACGTGRAPEGAVSQRPAPPARAAPATTNSTVEAMAADWGG